MPHRRKNRTREKVVDPYASEGMRGEAEEWLRNQVKTNRSDSGLPTRFMFWVADRYSLPIAYTQLSEYFLACCASIRIRAHIVNDRFIFGFVPVGDDRPIIPIPEAIDMKHELEVIEEVFGPDSGEDGGI